MRVYRRVERRDRVMILLVLVSAVHFTTACLQGAPDITSTNNPSSTPTGIQGIVLSSSFTCDGRVNGWTACFASDPTTVHYTMHFHVWRPGNNGCHELLGTNMLPTTAPSSNAQFDVFDTYCIKVQVPRDQQIVVEPNDFIGFFITINGPSLANTGGLLLDTNAFGAIVLGNGPCFGVVTQLNGGPQAAILGAPLLSALVDDIVEGDQGSISAIQIPSTSLTHDISSTSSTEWPLPVSTVHTLPHHTQSPALLPVSHTQSPVQVSTSYTSILAQISTTYSQSSACTSTKSTTATRSIQLTSRGNTVQANGSMVTLTQTVPELSRPSSSTSRCAQRPSISLFSTQEAEETRHRSNTLESTTKYALVAVGLVLIFVSTLLATIAVLCVRKYRTKKKKCKRDHGPTRAASEFIYNTTYERYLGHNGLITNLRQGSTQYHSHWSLTHGDDSDSIGYSYPALEMVEMENTYTTHGHNGTRNSSSADNLYSQTNRLPCETKGVFPGNVVIPNPFQSNEHSDSAQQKSSQGTRSTANTRLEQLPREKGYICQYNNPMFKRKQVESGESTVSVYYSEPVRQAGPAAIPLSKNEAYASKNPMSFLLSENEAYKSQNASGESGYGATDSVYYTSPTVIGSEEKDEFEVSSNLAYGTSPTTIELL